MEIEENLKKIMDEPGVGDIWMLHAKIAFARALLAERKGNEKEALLFLDDAIWIEKQGREYAKNH